MMPLDHDRWPPPSAEPVMAREWQSWHWGLPGTTTAVAAYGVRFERRTPASGDDHVVSRPLREWLYLWLEWAVTGDPQALLTQRFYVTGPAWDAWVCQDRETVTAAVARIRATYGVQVRPGP
jgi:hypothetical protein